MRKSFVYYVVAWVVSFILFNVAIFLIPTTINGWTVMEILAVIAAILASVGVNSSGLSRSVLSNVNIDPEVLKTEFAKAKNFYVDNKEELDEIAIKAKEALDADWFYKYGGSFWPGYIVIIVAFIIQLVCSCFAFKEKNNQKFFYNISIIKLSYSNLVLTALVGIACMFVPDVPIWLGIAVSVITTALSVFSLLKASLAVEYADNIDQKVAGSISFIKEITATAKTLFDNCDTQDKNELKKLYEEIRFSDPMSNELVAQEEGMIKTKLESLKTVVAAHGSIDDLVNEIIDLVKTRNSKIKSSK